MTYEEGLAIAQKYGLENEYTEAYEAAQYENNGYGQDKTEDELVYDALSEWDLI